LPAACHNTVEARSMIKLESDNPAAELATLRRRVQELEQQLGQQAAAASDEALRRQLQQMLALVEDHARHVPGILYQTRGRPDGTGFSLPFIRGRTVEYLGYTPAEIQQQPMLFLESIHPEDWQSCIAAGSEA